MAFTVSGSQILISGNETLASFATWANSNSQATRHDNEVVEANNQLKIQNWANFDTSLWTLIINHRVEGQNNNTSDSGIWKCHGGCVIQQWTRLNYAEWWVIMDFDRAHFISNKSGGQQSFFRSNGSATWISVLNSTFIHNSWAVDGHLQFSAWTWVVKNTYFESKTGGTSYLLIRDSDSDWISLIGIDLWGWNTLTQPTTFHKNMVFDHWSGADARNIVYYYRRNNYPIFYNPVNQADWQRITTISYKSFWSWGTTGRWIIVWKFEPVLEDQNWNLLSNVKIEIRKISDDIIEQTATTGSNGKANITGNTHSISWNGRDIDEAGILYIKQSITPTTAGAVNSVDQWNFRIRMRKKELNFFQSIQSFQNDFDGSKIIQTDSLFTWSITDFTTLRNLNTAEDIYNDFKYYGEQNIDSDISISRSWSEIDFWSYNIVFNQNATSSFNVSWNTITIKASTLASWNIFKTTGTIVFQNWASSWDVSIFDSTADSDAIITLPSWWYNNKWFFFSCILLNRYK